MILFLSNQGYKIVELEFSEAITHFNGTSLIDDMSNESIPLHSDKAYYIPVLNYMVHRKSFLEWEKDCKFYESDIKYQDRNIDLYFGSKLELTRNYRPD